MTERISAGDGDSKVAKLLAPEEVRVGDFVAVMQVMYELPSFYWCADAMLVPHDKPVRLQFLCQESGARRTGKIKA